MTPTEAELDAWIKTAWETPPPWSREGLREVYEQTRASEEQSRARSVEAQRIHRLEAENADLRRRVAKIEARTADDGPLIKSIALVIGKRVAALEETHDKLFGTPDTKGGLEHVLDRIEALEQRPAGMQYRGIWAADFEYPGSAVVTPQGVAWFATQPAHPGEKPGAGGPWKAIMKSDEAMLRQMVRDELKRGPTAR